MEITRKFEVLKIETLRSASNGIDEFTLTTAICWMKTFTERLGFNASINPGSKTARKVKKRLNAPHNRIQ